MWPAERVSIYDFGEEEKKIIFSIRSAQGLFGYTFITITTYVCVLGCV